LSEDGKSIRQEGEKCVIYTHVGLVSQLEKDQLLFLYASVSIHPCHGHLLECVVGIKHPARVDAVTHGLNAEFSVPCHIISPPPKKEGEAVRKIRAICCNALEEWGILRLILSDATSDDAAESRTVSEARHKNSGARKTRG
jgi:hypothetical protein